MFASTAGQNCCRIAEVASNLRFQFSPRVQPAVSFVDVVTLCLILHHRFSAKVHQGCSAKVHQGCSAKMHHEFTAKVHHSNG
jgi:predicted Na+-dependent transporter